MAGMNSQLTVSMIDEFRVARIGDGTHSSSGFASRWQPRRRGRCQGTKRLSRGQRDGGEASTRTSGQQSGRQVQLKRLLCFSSRKICTLATASM